MASIRALSTTELGSLRYTRCAASRTWFVQARVPVTAGDTRAYKLLIGREVEVPLTPTEHGDLRATAIVPLGDHDYKITSGEGCEETLGPGPHAEGTIAVSLGEAPIGSTRLASELKGRGPSGASQASPAADGCAAVRFVYDEETHAARVVFAEVDGVRTQLAREHCGEFVGEASLPTGVSYVRFRVVPREWCRPEAAAFTRLGWDDAAGERGVLVSWPLRVEVTEQAGDGAVAGEPADDLVVVPVAAEKAAAVETPENLATAPENLATAPESLATAPENVATAPENVATIPESLATTPESRATPEAPEVAESTATKADSCGDGTSSGGGSCGNGTGLGALLLGIAAIVGGLAVAAVVGGQRGGVEADEPAAGQTVAAAGAADTGAADTGAADTSAADKGEADRRKLARELLRHMQTLPL